MLLLNFAKLIDLTRQNNHVRRSSVPMMP